MILKESVSDTDFLKIWNIYQMFFFSVVRGGGALPEEPNQAYSGNTKNDSPNVPLAKSLLPLNSWGLTDLHFLVFI